MVQTSNILANIDTQTITKNTKYINSVINIPIVITENKEISKNINDEITNNIMKFFNESESQAKEYYKKLFVNYPDVLSVEEATTLLGFKSQTAIIRRIHQHRIRCLKVGRSFMIPKEYLIDYLLDS